MKKILYTMLVALAATFSFTSCEDVPAPYDTPNGGNGGGNAELAGDGTDANPYTVTDIKTGGATGENVFVKAYIVGYVPDKSLSEAVFSADGCQATSNVLIAASADETSVDNVMPVQLPAGDVRSAVNLQDNPGNIKQEVVLCGNVETYFGKTGLKSVVWAKIGSKEVGSKPGATVPGEAKGTGTKEDPFNCVAALNYTKALAADAVSEQEIYIKGKIVTISEEYNTNYGNATYYISEDGTASNQFYVYHSLYFGKTKYTSGTNIKVGDEVIVCGKVVNYKGNTPETQGNDSYIVSINGVTESGSTGGDQPSTPTEGGMGITEVIGGKTGAADLPTNAYGSQKVEDESTWYTWKYGNVNYTGVRICKSSDANGKGGIQLQGGTETAKQGFIFNSSAFGSDIKTVTLYVRGKNTYSTPTTFSLFEGTAAHPTASKLEGKIEGPVADGDFNTFTITFTFTAGNRFFTIWNNAQGALYIDKIAVELN